MGLSNDIISQFVKIANNKQKTQKKETITYGVVSKIVNEQAYVVLDGTATDQNGDRSAVPASITVSTKVGDRVIVMIKNHSAVITGNLGNPAINQAYVDVTTGIIKEVANEASSKADALENKVVEFGIALGKKLDVDEFTAEIAAIENLQTDSLLSQTVKANKANVDNLTAKNAEIEGVLEAVNANIENLTAGKATVGDLEAANAEIDDLKSSHAEFREATVDRLDSAEADIGELNAKKLDAESAAITYANIDFSNIGQVAMEYFYANSGLIGNVTVKDGVITGELQGVNISGDLIKANTIKADKLIVKGADGLYYKLNVSAGATTSEGITDDDLQNGLHGKSIIAKTITAEKISVSDLSAFGATIGGFKITESSLYSGVKSSVGNTTKGIYLDSDGQFVLGDSNNFIKYYKDAYDAYKLEISAASVLLGSGKKSVETAISEVDTKASNAQNSVDNLEIGGRNLLRNTSSESRSTTFSGWQQYLRSSFPFITSHLSRITGTQELTLSAYIENVAGTDPVGLMIHIVTPDVSSGYKQLVSTDRVEPGKSGWISVTGKVSDDGSITSATDVQVAIRHYSGTAGESTVNYHSVKLEFGNKRTDWTPAPEDMATAKEADTAQTTANNAEEKASNAQTLIAQLSESISMLVTDGNGTSLMTQTEDGWTFSTAAIQTSVNGVSEALDSLTTQVGDVGSAVGILQQAVADLSEIAEYVYITTYENEPCIELGEADSDFKLRITNTRMMFTEGSTVLAYFTNQAFNSKKVVIEEELQQGGFVWKVRSNGNLGLTWKGGTS